MQHNNCDSVYLIWQKKIYEESSSIYLFAHNFTFVYWNKNVTQRHVRSYAFETLNNIRSIVNLHIKLHVKLHFCGLLTLVQELIIDLKTLYVLQYIILSFMQVQRGWKNRNVHSELHQNVNQKNKLSSRKCIYFKILYNTVYISINSFNFKHSAAKFVIEIVEVNWIQ